MRIEELAHRHLEWVEANRAGGTFQNRRDFVKTFLDFIGTGMVAEITRSRLEDFHVWVVKKENKRRGKHGWKLSSNAGFEAMRHVRTFLRWGEEMELVELSFKRFPRLTYTPPETRRVDDSKLSILLAHADPDLKDFILFGLLTGLRPFENRTLQWSHIRRESGKPPFLFIEKNVKGAKLMRIPKPRSVPLSHEGEAILERQLKAHPKSPYIFLNEDGTPYTRYTLRDRFRRLSLACNMKKDSIVPYGLRHTFASNNSAGGTETYALAQLMGHSSIRTLQRYVTNTTQEHKVAVDRNEIKVLALLNAGQQTNGQG
jgi:integrase